MACKIPSPSVTVQFLLAKLTCLIEGFASSGGGSSTTSNSVSVYDPIGAPALNAEPVTPNDATTWPITECHSLWVGTGGTLVLTMANGDTTFTVPDGVWMPVRPTKVKAASTATNIVRVWN